jgi:hypothetical protein
LLAAQATSPADGSGGLPVKLRHRSAERAVPQLYAVRVVERGQATCVLLTQMS